jgi:uracil-DNA glycosylase
MANNQGWLDSIMARSNTALKQLSQTEIGGYIDYDLPLPRPFLGGEDIRLIIIGQDPTVQRANSRRHVKTVLNLDKKHRLRPYLEQICQDLGLSLDENVYATNACKNFFREPPTSIHEVNVLAASMPVWLPLLTEEVAAFPEAMVISLGEPVLAMLIKEGFPRDVKYYWGYHPKWKQGNRNVRQAVAAEQSTIGRPFHPFIHQPSSISPRAEFYRRTWKDYLNFVRQYKASE